MNIPAILTDEYLDRPEQWDALVGVLRDAGTVGLDSEYYGGIDGKSPVGRSRIHVWSVAVRSGSRSPLGYDRCRGWVLPAAALVHGGLVEVLQDRRILKAVHNQSVDHHALRNHGIELRGGINTLGLVRWMRPGLINQPGRFALKPLMSSLLGRLPVDTFDAVVSWEGTEPYATYRKEERTVCSCGVEGCRKRKTELRNTATEYPRAYVTHYEVPHDKRKETEVVETVRERKTSGEYPLESIIPGHERWSRLVKYALEDAVAALQVLELCEETEDPGEWLYGGERPPFSQRVEERIIAMEAVGIPVDGEWCQVTAAVAERDEDEELHWLFRWFVRNSDRMGPHRREDVDPIWSSPAKLILLFDELGFPRSPIWGKGRVKRGEWRLDGAAMAWIGKAHPDARQFTEHYLHLKRIRSGKKYLVKLRDSGGMVHPICGPSGDDDDRAGAVTGRLGIKGELEAQQLPTNEEKDLYFVRKAIIAGEGETVLVADYSSLEIGIQGDYALRLFGDEQIVKMYEAQALGVDMHSNNAREVFGRWLKWTIPSSVVVEGKPVLCQYHGETVDAIPVEVFKKHPFGKVCRDLIKTIWYGLAYGKGAYGFSTLIGADGKMIGEALAGQMVNALLDSVPAMRSWFLWVEGYVRKYHGIYSLDGRWCDLSQEMGSTEEWLHRRAFRRGFNFPMQAAGAGIIGDAMVRVGGCPRLKELGFRICLQVHDELVLRGPIEHVDEAKALVTRHMCAATANGTRLMFPLQVSAGHGPNYFEAK